MTFFLYAGKSVGSMRADRFGEGGGGCVEGLCSRFAVGMARLKVR